MRIGCLLPGFSSDPDDWAIPVQQNLAREIAKQDDLRVIALRYPHRRDRYVIDGVIVYSLGAGQVRGVGRLALWLDALRLITRLHHEKPFDLLHAMWADETGLIAAWAGRRLDVPVVVSILGGELVGLRDIGYGLQLSRFSRWIVDQALKGADRIVVPGSTVRRLIPTIPDHRIATITLGADADRFTPSGTPPDPNRLIHVASLVPVKDQATLLRALALLDLSVTLDMVGEGSERAKLEALSGDLGITGRVRFVGAVAHPDLPAVLSAGGAQRPQLAPRNHRYDHAGSRRLRRAHRQHRRGHPAGLSCNRGRGSGRGRSGAGGCDRVAALRLAAARSAGSVSARRRRARPEHPAHCRTPASAVSRINRSKRESTDCEPALSDPA